MSKQNNSFRWSRNVTWWVFNWNVFRSELSQRNLEIMRQLHLDLVLYVKFLLFVIENHYFSVLDSGTKEFRCFNPN